MTPASIKAIAQRHPFRPFTVWVTNGNSYLFNEAWQLGAPADFHMIFHFDEHEATRIDAAHITEIVE